MSRKFISDKEGVVYEANEKQGSLIWLIPLLVIPLIMWGVFAISDGLGSKADRIAQNSTSGVVPGIGGGPGSKDRLGIGNTAAMEGLQVN
jgi:hypothetical protein